MPNIFYVDFINGNDNNDGSAALPFSTITRATSTSIDTDDQIRVAQSPASTILTGTLAFVDGSTTVNTSDNIAWALSAGDFIGKYFAGPPGNPEGWWEVASVTSDAITLYAVYAGDTETVSGYKLGTTDTGVCTAAATNVQLITSTTKGVPSGYLQITGGWDLNTQVMSGQTWFRQTGFSPRNGRGLNFNANNTNPEYIEISGLGFLRYATGFKTDNYNTINVKNISCNSCQFNSTWVNIWTTVGLSSIFQNIYANSVAGSFGVYINLNNNIFAENIYAHSSGYGLNCTNINTDNTCIKGVYCYRNSNGYWANGTLGTTISGGIFRNNSYGLYINNFEFHRFYDVYLTNNSNYAMYISTVGGCTLINCELSGNTNGIYNTGDKRSISKPLYRAESYQKVAGDNRVVYIGGTVLRNGPASLSGSCLEFNTINSDNPIEYTIGYVPIISIDNNMSVSFFIKKDASWSGTVEVIASMFAEKLYRATLSPTTDWTEVTITLNKNQLILNELVKIWIYLIWC